LGGGEVLLHEPHCFGQRIESMIAKMSSIVAGGWKQLRRSPEVDVVIHGIKPTS
jgi:hypothetical protein